MLHVILQACDSPSTGKVLKAIVQMCFDLQEWELLNEHILLLTKKRGQLKTVCPPRVHSFALYISIIKYYILWVNISMYLVLYFGIFLSGCSIDGRAVLSLCGADSRLRDQIETNRHPQNCDWRKGVCFTTYSHRQIMSILYVLLHVYVYFWPVYNSFFLGGWLPTCTFMPADLCGSPKGTADDGVSQDQGSWWRHCLCCNHTTRTAGKPLNPSHTNCELKDTF